MNSLDKAFDTFIAESKEVLEEAEEALLELDSNDKDNVDMELIHSIFRALHTLKGSAGVFGVDAIVELSHAAETVLDAIRNQQLELSKALIQLLLNCRDGLEELVELVSNKQDFPASLLDDNEQLVSQLSQFYHITPSQTPSSVSEQQRNIPFQTWYIGFFPRRSVYRDGLDPLAFIRYLSQQASIVAIQTLDKALQLESDYHPTECQLAFQMLVTGKINRDTLEDIFEFISADAELYFLPQNAPSSDFKALAERMPQHEPQLSHFFQTHSLLQLEQNIEKAANLEPGSPPPAVKEPKSREKNPKIHQSKTLRVEALKLDRLIDQVGEMVITGARTNLLAHETGNENLIEAMGLLERLVENIRDSSLKLRMVQIGDTFNKFKRVVRDVSEELGKKAQLTISGAETELDKTFVEKISDPLLHLVRNAIDHGLEAPRDRAANNKPETGQIALNAYHDSGSIVIEISDDGRGLNTDKIIQRAIDNKLIKDDHELTEKDAQLLIFEPGFSTAEAVTNLSGRGVGMDVVKRNIDALRGSVEIDTQVDQGTTISIRLPLTLSIIDGFMFEVDEANYVIPLDTVVECLELHELVSEREIQDKNYLNLRDEVLPFIRLRSLFGIKSTQSHDKESLIIVQFGSLRAGLIVDSLKGEFQTVVKPLGRLFEGFKCVSGATILGSGNVAIILDVTALIKSSIAAYERKEAIRA